MRNSVSSQKYDGLVYMVGTIARFQVGFHKDRALLAHLAAAIAQRSHLCSQYKELRVSRSYHPRWMWHGLALVLIRITQC
jgi:hypothetical protein